MYIKDTYIILLCTIMKLVQPDGTHCIGINYEEERPSCIRSVT